MSTSSYASAYWTERDQNFKIETRHYGDLEALRTNTIYSLKGSHICRVPCHSVSVQSDCAVVPWTSTEYFLKYGVKKGHSPSSQTVPKTCKRKRKTPLIPEILKKYPKYPPIIIAHPRRSHRRQDDLQDGHVLRGAADPEQQRDPGHMHHGLGLLRECAAPLVRRVTRRSLFAHRSHYYLLFIPVSWVVRTWE